VEVKCHTVTHDQAAVFSFWVSHLMDSYDNY